MTTRLLSNQLRATLLAAEWAQILGLPAGNLWEPAVARYILSQYQKYLSWGFVEAVVRIQLGLDAPK